MRSRSWTNGEIPRWCFIFISVGDCKAFLYSRRKVEEHICFPFSLKQTSVADKLCLNQKGTFQDITVGNRMEVNDPRDPGGRLGPYINDFDPDLRNLALACVSCEVSLITSVLRVFIQR